MQHTVGAIVEGKVTGITNFGVFVEIDKGVTGMVHISEVSTSFVNDINEFVKLGDTVKVKIMTMGDNGKISLSMRRAVENEERKPKGNFRNRERQGGERNFQKSRPTDNGRKAEYVAPQKSSSDSFEDMMARFKQSSDEKFMDLKRKTGAPARNRKAPKM